jgi:hypothetical protein
MRYLILVALILFFSAGQANAWTWGMDFEDGTPGTIANGTSGFDEGFSDTKYSTEQLITVGPTNTQNAKCVSTEGVGWWGTVGGISYHPTHVFEGDEFWARGYYYFKTPWDWTADPTVKILRGLMVKYVGGSSAGALSVFAVSSGQITLSNELGDVQTDTGVNYTLNGWQSIEMYVKLSATPGVAIFRIWKDGILIIEDTAAKTLKNSDDYGDDVYIFTTWNQTPPQDQVGYIDDFVFTTDQPANQDVAGNYMIGPLVWGEAVEGTEGRTAGSGELEELGL